MVLHTDETLMREAIALASENVRNGNGGPFGALIVRDGTVVSRGVNLVTATNDPTAHAEITAIRAACKTLARYDLHGCVIYSSCEPCPMCLAAIYWARLDGIVFGSTVTDAARAGFDDGSIYREMHLPHGERAIPIRTVLYDEAQTSFALWAQSANRISY